MRVVTDEGALRAALMPGLEATSERLALAGQASARARARVRTGAMRAGISITAVGVAGRRVCATVSYSIFNEFGTWKMSAQPFMRPSMADLHL